MHLISQISVNPLAVVLPNGFSIVSKKTVYTSHEAVEKKFVATVQLSNSYILAPIQL
jgi:hypothetical protein